MRLKILNILLALVLITSCSEEKSSLDSKTSDSNEWIHLVMKTNYLWNDEVLAIGNYDQSLSYDKFFASLISPNEYRYREDKTYYYYSYIKEKSAATRASSSGEVTYGMEMVIYVDSKNNQALGRVFYVLPGSPAEEAGVKRGMWLLGVNGQSVTYGEYSKLFAGDAAVLNVYYGNYGSGSAQDEMMALNIGAARAIDEDPILCHKVFDYGSTKVAYLSYNSFSTGPGGFDDKSWEQELQDVFSEFKSAGANELILDLRYNGGGYLSTARTLASLIVPSRCANKTFCKYKYNQDLSSQNGTVVFSSSLSDKGIGVERVYILTGNATASASEAIINGLKANGIIEVIQIGDCTEGKNLGSDVHESDKYNLEMHPITCRIYNGDDFGDYANGFTPDERLIIDEFGYDDNLRVYPLWGELGTADDWLIAMALSEIGVADQPSVRVSAMGSRAASVSSGIVSVGNTLNRKSVGSVIMK